MDWQRVSFALLSIRWEEMLGVLSAINYMAMHILYLIAMFPQVVLGVFPALGRSRMKESSR